MTGDVSGDQSAESEPAGEPVRDPFLPVDATGSGPAAPLVPPAPVPVQAYPPPPGYAPVPPPGYAPAPVYGYPPPVAPRTDGFAIAALVFGIVGGVLFALVFGLVALSRIKRSHGTKSGRGLAIAGLVLAAVWTVAVVGLVAVALTTQASRDPVTGSVVDGGSVSVEDVTVGDCLAELLGEGDVRSVQVVPCTEAHHGEAFAAFTLADGSYPGEDAVISQAEEGCTNRVPDDLDEDLAKQLSLFYLYPKKSNWVLGHRDVVCIASSTAALSQPLVP